MKCQQNFSSQINRIWLSAHFMLYATSFICMSLDFIAISLAKRKKTVRKIFNKCCNMSRSLFSPIKHKILYIFDWIYCLFWWFTFYTHFGFFFFIFLALSWNEAKNNNFLIIAFSVFGPKINISANNKFSIFGYTYMPNIYYLCCWIQVWPTNRTGECT